MSSVASDPPLPREPESSSAPTASASTDVPGQSLPAGDGSREWSAVPLNRAIAPSALTTLFGITVSRQLRGRRLLIFSLLFSLPIIYAVLAHRFLDPYRADEVESILVFGLIPQALVPLTALLFASGMVQDEVEEQTLTYFLIRPIPRWLVYLTKLAATWLVTACLTALFASCAEVTIFWGTEDFDPSALARRAAVVSGLLAISLLAYSAVFGLLGLLVRRPLVMGAVYIMVLEGAVANIDFMVRRSTIMYYVRTLSIRWLNVSAADWSIDTDDAPGAAACVITLLSIAGVLSLLGAWIFSIREFRVKTPEGT